MRSTSDTALVSLEPGRRLRRMLSWGLEAWATRGPEETWAEAGAWRGRVVGKPGPSKSRGQFVTKSLGQGRVRTSLPTKETSLPSQPSQGWAMCHVSEKNQTGRQADLGGQDGRGLSNVSG